MKCFIASSEIDGIQRIEFHKFERHFYPAFIHKFLENIGHTEKTGSGIKCESICLHLIKSASGLGIHFQYFYFKSFFGKEQTARQSAQTGTYNNYFFVHFFDFLERNLGYKLFFTQVNCGDILNILR